ncbi:MAG: S9 family peptidase [Pseudomonadales bacterium]
MGKVFDITAIRLLGLGAVLLLSACAAQPGPAPAQSIGNLEVRGVPEVPPAVAEGLQQYRNTRSARLHGWLGDGILIGTRFGETSQLHRVEQPQGARRQITFFDEPVAAALVANRPQPEGFIYTRDVGGSEFFQLFWFDLASGHSRLLSDGRSRYTGAVISNGGDRFAYTTTERNGRDWDIHVQTLSGGTAVALEAGGVGWAVADFSPDDSHLLVSRYVSINESYLYQLSLDDGSLTPLFDPPLRMAVRQAQYTPDGTGVLFTADMGTEFLRLHRLDLGSGRIRLLSGDIDWDVEQFAVADTGNYLAFTVNEGGYSRLHVWHLPALSPVALPEVPKGIIGGLIFHPAGDRLGFTLALPTAPADVYSAHLGRRALTAWTRSEAGGLDRAATVAPELIDYPTFDAVDGAPRRIPAFVYRPQRPGPHPVLISIHGGPEAQYRPFFSPMVQYYVNELGMAVVAPNVRGSAGYGKSYLQLDNGRLREDAVHDIGALLDWIAAEPDLDAERVVVTGGSYGGYMVLASLVHFGDRLTAGVSRVGISNFVSFLTNTEPYRQELRRVEYGDERDPEMRAFLERISPLSNVERMSRPLLILQGANDPRVPASESAQIYHALHARGVPVWYVLAGDEGHGFRKKFNSDYAAAATATFLQRFVLP